MNKYSNKNKLDTPRGHNEAYVNRVGKALSDYASPNEYIIKREVLSSDIDTFITNLNSLSFNLSEFNQLKGKILSYIVVQTNDGLIPNHTIFVKTNYDIASNGTEKIVFNNFNHNGDVINITLSKSIATNTIQVSAQLYSYISSEDAEKNYTTYTLKDIGGSIQLLGANGSVSSVPFGDKYLEAYIREIQTIGVKASTNEQNIASNKAEIDDNYDMLCGIDDYAVELGRRVYSLEQLLNTGGGSGNVGLATLVGTTLKFNSDLGFIEGLETINLTFTCNGNTYQKITYTYNSTDNIYVMLYDDTEVYVEDTVGGALWVNENYRTITVAGGDDATNSNAIAWATGNSNIITSGTGSGGIDTSVFVTVGSLNNKLAEYAKTSVTDSIQNQVKIINDNYIKSISYQEGSGIFTFVVQKDGVEETKSIDLAIEKVVANFVYDANTEELVLTLADGTTQRVPMSALVVDGYTKTEADNLFATKQSFDTTVLGINTILNDLPNTYVSKTSMATFEANTLQRFETLESRAANIELNVTSNETSIGQLQDQITGTETDLQELDDRITTLEQNQGSGGSTSSVSAFITESVVISEFSALETAQGAYTHFVDITLTNSLDTMTSIELVNNNPVLFSTYGFAIASASGTSVVVYSIGKPSEDVTLTFEMHETVEVWDGSYTEGETVSLITFTIAGTSYQAEEGMTWTEWCSSEYNTGTFYTSDNSYVYTANPSTVIVANGSNWFNGSTVIIADTAYTTVDTND